MPPLCPFCRHCCRCFVEYLPCCIADIRNTTCAMYGCSARRRPWLPWWPFPANPLTRRPAEAYCCLGMARWRSCRARSASDDVCLRSGPTNVGLDWQLLIGYSVHIAWIVWYLLAVSVCACAWPLFGTPASHLPVGLHSACRAQVPPVWRRCWSSRRRLLRMAARGPSPAPLVERCSERPPWFVHCRARSTWDDVCLGPRSGRANVGFELQLLLGHSLSLSTHPAAVLVDVFVE